MDEDVSHSETITEVAIVGGGPAGLVAATYLARFHRNVMVIDAGDGRAQHIPRSHNVPGFPEGISGPHILARLRDQAHKNGATLIESRVEHVEQRSGGFLLTTAAGYSVIARRAILATGVVDLAPEIPGLLRAIQDGVVRLCPICDAYEATGKTLGVAGPDHNALSEALFLLDYSDRVIILSNLPDQIRDEVRRQAEVAGIKIWDTVDTILPVPSGIEICFADGTKAHLDVLYPAMGCEVRSELGATLGAECDADGCLLVDDHLQTSIAGLYAIGDVTPALNQIAVGFGQAAIAATDIHNNLRTAMSELDAQCIEARMNQ